MAAPEDIDLRRFAATRRDAALRSSPLRHSLRAISECRARPEAQPRRRGRRCTGASIERSTPSSAKRRASMRPSRGYVRRAFREAEEDRSSRLRPCRRKNSASAWSSGAIGFCVRTSVGSKHRSSTNGRVPQLWHDREPHCRGQKAFTSLACPGFSPGVRKAVSPAFPATPATSSLGSKKSRWARGQKKAHSRGGEIGPSAVSASDDDAAPAEAGSRRPSLPRGV